MNCQEEKETKQVTKENCIVNDNQGDDSQEENTTTVVTKNNCTANDNHVKKRPLPDTDILDDTKLPKLLKDMFQPLRCDLCKVIASSSLTAYTHYEGKGHRKKVTAYMKEHHNVDFTTTKKSKIEIVPLTCNVCNVILSSDIVYKQHLAGKQHRKNLKRNNVMPSIPPLVNDQTGRFGIGTAFLDETNQTKTSTSPMVTPPSDPFWNTKSHCKVCNIYTDTEEQLKFHEQGQKHMKKLKVLNEKTNGRIAAGFYNERDVWQASPSQQ